MKGKTGKPGMPTDFARTMKDLHKSSRCRSLGMGMSFVPAYCPRQHSVLLADAHIVCKVFVAAAKELV